MKVRELIIELRKLVLHTPAASNEEVVLAPHGTGHRQAIGRVHLNEHGTKIVIESEK